MSAGSTAVRRDAEQHVQNTESKPKLQMKARGTQKEAKRPGFMDATEA